MSAGRTAIVTGSTSGIGLGIARAFAKAGMNVVLNGFGDPAAIEELTASIAAESGAQVRHDIADMSDPDEIAAMVEASRIAFGAIDIIVNNAGIQTVAPIEEFPIDRYDMIMSVNMSSAWHLTRLTFAEMKARRWGRVINIASAHGLEQYAFRWNQLNAFLALDSIASRARAAFK